MLCKSCAALKSQKNLIQEALALVYFSVCNSPTEHTCCCYFSSKNTLSKFPRKLNGMKFYGAHTHPLLPDVNWILTLNVKYFEEVQKWRFPFNEWKSCLTWCPTFCWNFNTPFVSLCHSENAHKSCTILLILNRM